MKPIETHYNGYRFRSRLEARWAVFFDTLGIPYEYEKEGYDLEGTWYLPDFWLPNQQCWIEIKGQLPTREESRKAHLLALTSNHPVYIFDGLWIPGVDDIYEGMGMSLKKGASCCNPNLASIFGIDTTSPCYKICSHLSYENNPRNCPYTHYIDNIGEEGKLVRALYVAEILASYGDNCKLKLSSNSDLQYFRFDENSTKYEEIPIPKCIQEHYATYVSFFQRFTSNWEWSICSVGDLLYAVTEQRWCQCSFCGKYGITDQGNEGLLPCHLIHKRQAGRRNYYPLSEQDRTEELLAAYTAARQARFEQR